MSLIASFVMVLAACVAPAGAEEFLMSTNQSTINNPRAQSFGHNVTARSIVDIVASNDLDQFDVVWINPNPTAADYNALRTGSANGGTLETYARTGGTLVLNVVGNQGNQADIAPGGIDFNRSVIHDNETIAEPDHPYITGAGYGGAQLNEGMFVNWFNTDHGWLEDLVNGATTVVKNVDGPTWVEYPWGGGTVIVTCMTYGWGINGARAEPLDNLIKYSASVSGAVCNYLIKKSKPKGGCGACPPKGGNYASNTPCEDVGECAKKVKTVISCPGGGNGTCKIKGKRTSCG
ncbi:MAG: hypothetical protein C4547_07145 [Phycisphaerales bacterium]|nr:MAG: hypothetical protein C4547_07145 [Phycisphaerales bacterium]